MTSTSEPSLKTSQKEYFLAVFDQAIEERPNDAMAHLNRAATLYSMGRNDEALESFERAIELDPGARSHIVKGSMLFDMGYNDKARESLDRATEIGFANAKEYNIEDAYLHILQRNAARPVSVESNQ